MSGARLKERTPEMVGMSIGTKAQAGKTWGMKTTRGIMMKSNLTIPLEIKALSNGEFEGHGSIFGNEDLGGDVVMPGAFRKSLAKHAKSNSLPQMFWMHKPD